MEESFFISGKVHKFVLMIEKDTLVERKIPVTAFDKEVVKLLADGHKVNDIALKKDVNRRTLESKIDKLKVELGLKNIPNLVAYFIRQKLIQ